ncbi:MAG: hypothetical protein M3X11_20135 [Acidobacteriota bacterium]|nr:hypothetical protein [Acidobacteriota bacterium]
MKQIEARLKSALAQREQQARPLHLFFRDDDVDEDEASLRRLLDLFLSHQTPVNLGVIPGRLTQAAIELLNDYSHRHLSLLELNQHGWRHVNHEPEGKKCEFGLHRVFSEQFADIASGQARMNEAFGGRWFPAFIPPWNRCTNETARALDQLGFRVLSRDQGQPLFAGYGFCELPVTLDIYRWRGGAMLRPEEELARELVQQIARQDRIGVMLHHKVMDDEAFALLQMLLTEMRGSQAVRFHTFQSLLETS